MSGNWFQRRRDRRNLDYSVLTTGHPLYGRLDGEDPKGFSIDLPELTLEEQMAVAATQRIAQLEQDLEEAFRLLGWQGSVIAAAREFVTLLGATSTKNGENVFKTTQDDDTLAAQALNHRFVDLAALLNESIRPVPPKLAQGTVH